jgi:UDP-2,3-diacylglucosamine hydrolase
MPTTSPEQVTYFIADLHLAEDRPDITRCFIDFLNADAVKAQALYILGDLFESWIGDDDNSDLNNTVASALSALTLSGTKIYYIHGNRDFLIGKKYAKKSSMILLPEVDCIELYGKKIVIMHGDTLCTRDIDYQAFRKKSRSWWWPNLMLMLPLSVRRKKAADYRKRSKAATALKAQDIMDVTPSEVVACLEEYHCQYMIHGHTHRPAIHNIEANGLPAQRLVLGDWYEQGAWLKVTSDGMVLLNNQLI